ncbi:ethanolamine ammonia-lyase reactivating factor EutA [Polyangium sorediatum]|uniref:Ethanolamine ammonia-lyase reactivating factor EutA n=1 Tax=Polyangium sorediatum TaxID=889274 RepID=A0ABT6P613_9BACT|nr:ethanolamine ammonia-lyase reactivating factor EutA [Polyangium sorediatum]MDI1436048.1 ethanolamine ammonia-lyase reactivating factor EutA [Polyangium sorediatum]
MSGTVSLLGLDFGSTTCSAMVASATMVRNCVTGRMELSRLTEEVRSVPVFTPLREGRIDEAAVAALLDGWLAGGGLEGKAIFGGGALITGLAAQRENAAALASLLRARLGDAILVATGDANLESWMAFLGSAARLSRRHPEVEILNLDMGGGTTNLALGIDGDVRRTGCLFVGARHVQVEPGTYRIVSLSRYARALLDHLGMARGPGDELSPGDVDVVLSFYVALLEAAVTGHAEAFTTDAARLHLHTDIALEPPAPHVPRIVTLSGGVGALVYDKLRGAPWPSTTLFGDLGIDLAQRILSSDVLARDLSAWIPDHFGRATVFGMMRHSMDISGATVFLSSPDVLPLRDLPILGRLGSDADAGRVDTLLRLVRESQAGGCLRIEGAGPSLAALRRLGALLGDVLRAHPLRPEQTLVLFVAENVGKTLGHYVSDWGKSPLKLVVIDEVAVKDARFAQIGRMKGHVVPVWYYGQE